MYSRDKVSIMHNGGVLTVTFPNGEFYSLYKDDPRYGRAVDAFRRGDYSPETFSQLMNTRKELIKWGKGKVLLDQDDNVVVVKDGQEYPVNEALGSVLREYINNQLLVDAFVNFVIRLMRNPSMRSRDLFYDFIKKYNMSFTSDGMCRAYKAITSDWKDKHTHKVDNCIGVTTPRLSRAEVDDNPDNACSFGLKCGAPYTSNCIVIISE